VTDLEAFKQRYQRAKRSRAHRAKMTIARRTVAENNARRRKKRARLVLEAIEYGADRFEAAALCNCNEEALRQWLYTQTGSSYWPPVPEDVAKLIDIAGK
jgi:hypothetical protein